MVYWKQLAWLLRVNCQLAWQIIQSLAQWILLRDSMCGCMSARNKDKFEKVQGVTRLSFLLLWAVPYSQMTFLEKCMFSLFLSMLIVKVHRWISLGILYMSSSAFGSYCIFNCREKVQITAESSASLFNLHRSRVENCGLMLAWREIKEGTAIHVTGSEPWPSR